MYTWHPEVIFQYQEAFLRGAITTIELSILSIALALLLGTLLGIARTYAPNTSIRNLLACVIETLRAIPKIVVLVWLFYALPTLTGINLPPFGTAVIGLSVVSSAFIAEIVRAGIDAIPKGQVEAALTLGMSRYHITMSIVIPQVFMRNAPAFAGEFSTIIKDSAIAMLIGVNELLHVTSGAAITSYRPLELYTILGLLFLVLVIPISMLSKRLEFKELTKAGLGAKGCS